MPKKRGTLKVFKTYAEARAYFREFGIARMYKSRSGKLKRLNATTN